MYLLTNCAACAAPLALDAPRCVRCQTRYAEKAATRYAIEQLSSSASSLEIQAFAESCFGAPRGALDAKKAAIDDLWREAQNG